MPMVAAVICTTRGPAASGVVRDLTLEKFFLAGARTGSIVAGGDRDHERAVARVLDRDLGPAGCSQNG